MNAILEPLLRSPHLIDHLGELQRIVKLEQQRRHRFYDELTEDGKFEFINGEVIMHSPAKDRHNLTRTYLAKLLDAYVEERDLGAVRDEKALCVFPRNDYEPDVVFFGPEKARLIGPDTLKYPIPDFIIEVLSDSTEHLDRGVKFQDYAAHGVAEYWIVDAARKTVEKHVARDGRYTKARAQRAGTIASDTVAGFEIPLRAIFEGKANRAELRRLLA